VSKWPKAILRTFTGQFATSWALARMWQTGIGRPDTKSPHQVVFLYSNLSQDSLGISWALARIYQTGIGKETQKPPPSRVVVFDFI